MWLFVYIQPRKKNTLFVNKEFLDHIPCWKLLTHITLAVYNNEVLHCLGGLLLNKLTTISFYFSENQNTFELGF